MRIIDKIILSSTFSDAESRRIKLLKMFNYTVISFHFLYSIGYFIIDYKLLYLHIINLLVFIIPYILSLKLLTKGQYNTAKTLLIYFAPWPVIIGSVFFLGREAGLHFYLLLYAVLSIILWELSNKWQVIAIFCFNVGGFLFIQYVKLDQFEITKLPSEYRLFHAGVCYIITFIIVGTVVLWYQTATERFENLLKEKSDNLITANDQLMEQKEIISEVNTQLEERQQHIEEQSETLMRINNELNELVATKDKFFSIIAHDLKNPLNALMGFSELLYANHGTFDESKKNTMLGIIYESSKRSYNLLENLLTWARMQTGGIKINPEKINLHDLILETSRVLENMRTNKNIDLELNIDKSHEVETDRYMLITVVNNLLSNALKFTPKSGKIRISSELSDNYITVCISDTGIGIPPENISQLFKIDQSYSTMGTNHEKGSGLGLLLCKEFIEKNSGKIWVESELKKGSTFFFTIKAASNL